MAKDTTEAERAANAVTRAETRRSIAVENVTELEDRQAEARRKADAEHAAAVNAKTVSVMVRAKEPGFNVGRRRVDEIFSYEGARVGDGNEPVLPSWVVALTGDELAKLAEKEQAEAQYPPEYRLSLGQSSSQPPAPGVKPTQMRNPADGVKTAGEAGISSDNPRTLSEGSKVLDPGSNARPGSLAAGARDSGADLA